MTAPLLRQFGQFMSLRVHFPETHFRSEVDDSHDPEPSKLEGHTSPTLGVYVQSGVC